MEIHKCFSLVLICFICFVYTSQAYNEIQVGGNEGWTSMDYTHWSQGIMFRVNDFLLFKYNAGSDSVLEVKKEDYYNCNKENPIRKMESGRSLFMLDTNGPFYFISGNNGRCEKGQKLVIVVSDGKSGAHAPVPSESPDGKPGGAQAPPPSESSDNDQSGGQAPPPSESSGGQPGGQAPPPSESSGGQPGGQTLSKKSVAPRVVVTPSVLLVLVVTLLLSVGFGSINNGL